MAVMRQVLTGSLIGVLACAVPARADIVAQTAQGFVSRNVVVVAASPAAVWKRLITPAVWWSSDHTFSGDAANLSLDPEAGGCFCERLPGEVAPPIKGAKAGVRAASRGGVEHMHVVYAERGKALRMTGALGPLQSEAVNATLTVTLKPIDGGTRIMFEYVVGGFMRYPPEKIVPAIDTVMGNQLLGLAHAFAPGPVSPTSDQPDNAPRPAQSPEPADASAPVGRGLDKRGLLLPRGRIWSLPPSDTPAPVVPESAGPEPVVPVPAPPTPEPSPPVTAPPAPVVAPLPTAAVPQDVTPSGGAKARERREDEVPEPVAPQPGGTAPGSAQPEMVPPTTTEATTGSVTTDAAKPDPATTAPTVPKTRGKSAHKTPPKPVTPPKPDEPTTDAVNSAFDNALGDPQRPVPTTP